MGKLGPRLVLLAAAAASLAAAGPALAYTQLPSNGYAGAPGETTCGQSHCHMLGAAPVPAISFALIDASTGAPFTCYQPGTRTRLRIDLLAPGASGIVSWGFQATVLDGNGAQWDHPFTTRVAENRVAFQWFESKQHVGHSVAGRDGTATGASWLVDFDAPPRGTGPVTFYACGMAMTSRFSGHSGCGTISVRESAAVAPGDADSDAWSDAAEAVSGTDPADADTDDDGLADGEEQAMYGTDPLSCDTDADTLPDGLEVGRTGPVAAPDCAGLLGGTDPAAGCFIADADPASTTDPRRASTDDRLAAGTDDCLDGMEDANRNGRVDIGETDPRAEDCATTDVLLGLRIDATILSLRGGAAAACGALTTPPLATLASTSCAAPPAGCTPAPWVLATPGLVVAYRMFPAVDDMLRAGEALPGAEPGVLTLYELEDCARDLLVFKAGDDLVLDAR